MINLFDFSQKVDYKTEILAGLTDALALIHKQGKKLHLKHLSPDCRNLLDKAGAIIEVNILEDPTFKVAVDSF